MTLPEEAIRRVELARQIGREPLCWRTATAVASVLGDSDGTLAGLPIKPATHSWPLELVCAPLIPR